MGQAILEGPDRLDRALLLDMEWNVSYIILQFGWFTSRQKRAPSAAEVRK